MKNTNSKRTSNWSRRRGGRGGRGCGTTGQYAWRQYTKYCFLRGVNLHCNGSNCDRQGCNKKPNHNPTCTYANCITKGGSHYMEHQGMKWLNPKNQLCAEHGGEPTSEWWCWRKVEAFVCNYLMNVLNPVISTPLRKNDTVTKVAIDSGATGHVFPTSFEGGDHNPIHRKTKVNTAAGTVMEFKATDLFRFLGDNKQHKCKKFNEVNTPLASLGTLCQEKQMVGVFNNVDGRIYDKQTMTLIAKAPLDLSNNLYILDITAGVPRVGNNNDDATINTSNTSKSPKMVATNKNKTTYFQGWSVQQTANFPVLVHLQV